MSHIETPFRLRAGKWSYERLASKVRQHFGVKDAEVLFVSMVKVLRDTCQTHPMGIERYETLAEWHEAVTLMYRYADCDAA